MIYSHLNHFFLHQTAVNPSTVRMRHIIGASFENDSVIAWYNNDPLHSPPLALQYVTNTILKEKKLNQSVTFVNHPLPFTINTMVSRNLTFVICRRRNPPFRSSVSCNKQTSASKWPSTLGSAWRSCPPSTFFSASGSVL